MCSADVSKGVCPETGGEAQQRTLLQTLGQRSALEQSRPLDEGGEKQLQAASEGRVAYFENFSFLREFFICQ